MAEAQKDAYSTAFIWKRKCKNQNNPVRRVACWKTSFMLLGFSLRQFFHWSRRQLYYFECSNLIVQ